MSRGAVVVAGSMAGNRGRGGHTWLFLQFLLGFRRLGWDVLFVDRVDRRLGGDRARDEESAAIGYLAGVMEGFGLEDSFAVLGGGGGGGETASVGLSRSEVVRRTRGADLLLNVMGWLRDDEILGAARRRVLLDMDPGTGRIVHDPRAAEILGRHDHFVTTGENIGAPGCGLPDHGRPWITTPPPVVLALWEPELQENRRPATSSFTTVASWSAGEGLVRLGHERYGLRADGFRNLMPLPMLAGGRFEIALEIPPARRQARALLAGNGWTLLDPRIVAGDPWSYRAFIHRSGAELSVAKQLHVGTHSGRLSARTICYLASGRPVLAQDTGFADRYPTGWGLVAYRSLEEASEGVREIRENYELHARAAREIATEYFDSDRVLERLLERLGHA